MPPRVGIRAPDPIAEAMGWAPHAVRGFLAGLAKKGARVEVLERSGRFGTNKTGREGRLLGLSVGCRGGRLG
jgi:hypothetical protein